MICSKCGTKANEGDTICTNCKTSLQVVSYEFDMSVSDIFNMNNQDIIKSGKIKDNKSGDANTDKNMLMHNTKTDKKVRKKSVIVAAIIGIILIIPALIVIISVSEDKRHNVDADLGEDIINDGNSTSENVSHSADKDSNENVSNSTSESNDAGADQPDRTLILDKDIFEFTFSKYNGYGTPNVSMDIFKVYDALLPALGFTDVNMDTRPVMSEIYKHINVTFSEDSNLSNDQVITAYISVDENCLKEHNMEFENTEYPVVVNGLKDLKNVDIFEDLYINIAENNGDNSITWEYHGNDSLVIEKSIECYPDSGLNYGDKFVLSVNLEQLENLRQSYGINPVALEKEYVLLENKYEYLSDFDSVSDRMIENITDKDIKSMSNRFQNSAINTDDCKAIGGFIYRFEGSDNSDNENCLVFIYEVKEPYNNANIGSIYVWIAHFDIAANPYGLQKFLRDDTSMGYSSIIFNLDDGSLGGAGAKDAVDKVIDAYDMQEDRISYSTELRLYLNSEQNKRLD